MSLLKIVSNCFTTEGIVWQGFPPRAAITSPSGTVKTHDPGVAEISALALTIIALLVKSRSSNKRIKALAASRKVLIPLNLLPLVLVLAKQRRRQEKIDLSSLAINMAALSCLFFKRTKTSMCINALASTAYLTLIFGLAKINQMIRLIQTVNQNIENGTDYSLPNNARNLLSLNSHVSEDMDNFERYIFTASWVVGFKYTNNNVDNSLELPDNAVLERVQQAFDNAYKTVTGKEPPEPPEIPFLNPPV
ncbi:hypothetical protein COB21_02285 [Candidatus Aerophobetes bacterium]|uniref:Uncharacterized protein n=1 Tax=Aerophobetes bacterium TaxID=2030807 RepID=A0A2A4X5X5_UNCAE|nr:MAG: hypothetical protein COB21_02285 [Candidatus Aerophobetes bacterium]